MTDAHVQIDRSAQIPTVELDIDSTLDQLNLAFPRTAVPESCRDAGCVYTATVVPRTNRIILTHNDEPCGHVDARLLRHPRQMVEAITDRLRSSDCQRGAPKP